MDTIAEVNLVAFRILVVVSSDSFDSSFWGLVSSSGYYTRSYTLSTREDCFMSMISLESFCFDCFYLCKSSSKRAF